MLATVMLVIDGPEDGVEPALDHRSPLQCASKKHLDDLARTGGVVNLKWDGPAVVDAPERWCALAGFAVPFPPARGPLEASALEVPLSGRDLVFSAPLLGGDPDRIAPSGSMPSAAELSEVSALLSPLWSRKWRWFAEGGGAVLRWTDAVGRWILCKSPMEVEGAAVVESLPQGDGVDEVARLIWDSMDLLSRFPGNRRRIDAGLVPWLCVWPFAPGPIWIAPGTVPAGWSAVASDPMLLGLARTLGMRPVSVPTEGGMEMACHARAAMIVERLRRGDGVVWSHVRRRAGDLDRCLEEIQSIDRDLIGAVTQDLERRGERVRWRVAWGDANPVRLLESDPTVPLEGRLPFDARGFEETRREVRPGGLW